MNSAVQVPTTTGIPVPSTRNTTKATEICVHAPTHHVMIQTTHPQLCEVLDHEPHAGVDGLVVGELVHQAEQLLHVHAVVVQV